MQDLNFDVHVNVFFKKKRREKIKGDSANRVLKKLKRSRRLNKLRERRREQNLMGGGVIRLFVNAC